MGNKKQYIGKKEVSKVNNTGETTPLGCEIFEVEYVDGSKETLTKKILDVVLDDKECDLTELRRRRVEPVAKEMLVLLREANLKVGEVDFLLTLFTESINQNSEQASNKLWNVEEGGDRTFLQIDDILTDDGGK